uniref:Putative ovule protein n=1 Tax=Solanum chacoense TaxID=4108 RepID=A0A0V0GQ70_SOLCH
MVVHTFSLRKEAFNCYTRTKKIPYFITNYSKGDHIFFRVIYFTIKSDGCYFHTGCFSYRDGKMLPCCWIINIINPLI